MRPSALELSAFGPYLETQRIDFERLGEHGLFLIHGRTGSGKSSVLDALCFALFGKSTGDERRGEDFVSTLDRGADTKVMLEFEHLGVGYRVTRRPTQLIAKKRGAGYTTRQTDASLENFDSGEVIASRAGDVTAAVEEMLRCDVVQFRQTVVLPQGDFRRVVTEHKARRDILASIFRTKRFANVAERLSDAAKRLARQGQDLQEQRVQLLEAHGAENVGDLERLVIEADGVVLKSLASKRKASKAKDAAIASEAAGQAMVSDFEELGAERERAQELEQTKEEVWEKRRLAGRADKASRLVGQRDELENRRVEHRDLVDEVKGAQEAVDAAETELATRRDEKAALEEQRPLLDAAEETQKLLTAFKPQVDGLASKLTRKEQLRGDLERAEQSLESAKAAILGDEERKRELTAEQLNLQRAAEFEPEANGVLAGAEEDLKQGDRLADLRGDIAKLDASIAEHRGHSDPSALLTEAVTTDAPGLLARELDEGQPCPVCGSVHHPSPSLHGDVEALMRAFQEFGDALAELAAITEKREGYSREFRARLAERGWEKSPPPRAELERRVAAAHGKVDEQAAAKKRLGVIGKILAELADDRTEKDKRVDALRVESGAVKSSFDVIEGEVTGAVESLPPEHRDPTAFHLALAAARDESEKLRERFDGASESETRAEQALDRAQTALTSAEGRLKSAAETLDRLETAFSEKLIKAGFTGRSDFDDAALPEDELVELQQEVREHDEAVKLNAAAVSRLSKKLDGKVLPDMGALAAAVREAGEVETVAETAWTEATSAHERISGTLDRFLELQRKDADVADRRRAAQKLSDLANGTLKGRAKVNFETFVLRSIFARVLKEANHHLKNMTGGRYTMLLIDDPTGRETGLELNVRDNQSGGETRPVHTLSGGEGFLASLSLALGLSEISQRESGGIDFGALFIDEGFGSLDSQSLDQVIDILRGLEHGHRMVGIISHVEDLKQRIPVQLLVLDGPVGSRVEMRLNA